MTLERHQKDVLAVIAGVLIAFVFIALGALISPPAHGAPLSDDNCQQWAAFAKDTALERDKHKAASPEDNADWAVGYAKGAQSGAQQILDQRGPNNGSMVEGQDDVDGLVGFIAQIWTSPLSADQFAETTLKYCRQWRGRHPEAVLPNGSAPADEPPATPAPRHVEPNET